MISRKQRYMLWLLVTVLWMFIIYLKSAQPYHAQDLKPMLSTFVSSPRLEQLLPHMEFYYDRALVRSTSPYEFVEFFIRKGAHMGEYALLAFLWIQTLLSKPLKKTTALPLGGLMAILYAASDEWHQSFVPDRTGHFIDIIIDSIGVLFVLILFVICKRKTS
jgi:VanZ family protein